MAEVLSASQAVPQLYEGKEEYEDSVHSEPTSGSHEEPGLESALHIRIRSDEPGEEAEKEPSSAGALVVHSASALMTKDDDQPQDQLKVLLAELARIEGQQEKLRDAVRHNKGIVIHPRQEVLEESDSEYETPKAPTPKKQLVVSGGLTGFGVAQDLLQIDFSAPEEAPEEFRAVAFYEEPKQIKPGLSGSFGLCDPASKEMHYYLERLEEQQRLVLELITGKKQALVEQFGTKGSSTRAAKQGASKLRGGKSRLARNTRLGDSSEKSAVASALGLSAADKMASLGSKMGSLTLGKGALAAKLPMMGLSASGKRDQQSTSGLKAAAPRPESNMKPRKPMQAPARGAQVQKEDKERKEQEEQQALFAQPLPGSTPSTQHLAGKKAAKEKSTVEVRAQAESAETVPPVSSPQKHTPSKTQNKSGGRVGDAAEENAEVAGSKASTPAPEAGHRPGFLKGFKKLLSGKSNF